MAKRRSAEPRGAETDLAAEAKSFREAVRDVKPLPRSAAPAPQRAAALQPKTVRAAAAASRMRRAAAAGPPAAAEQPQPLLAATVTADEALSFRRPGVRDQAVRRLKRGGFPLEAEVDLHGLNQSGARDCLAQFLAESRDAGHRCVRIVHGKGYRSGARGPVLKSAVNEWLRRNLDVMAFTSARAIDGGTGAVYVLLRA
jgi:DNA-nicking Smr family endonuclease